MTRLNQTSTLRHNLYILEPVQGAFIARHCSSGSRAR